MSAQRLVVDNGSVVFVKVKVFVPNYLHMRCVPTKVPVIKGLFTRQTHLGYFTYFFFHLVSVRMLWMTKLPEYKQLCGSLFDLCEPTP